MAMPGDSGALRESTQHRQAASRDISQMKVQGGAVMGQGIAQGIESFRRAQMAAADLAMTQVRIKQEEIRRQEMYDKAQWASTLMQLEMQKAQKDLAVAETTDRMRQLQEKAGAVKLELDLANSVVPRGGKLYRPQPAGIGGRVDRVDWEELSPEEAQAHQQTQGYREKEAEIAHKRALASSPDARMDLEEERSRSREEAARIAAQSRESVAKERAAGGGTQRKALDMWANTIGRLTESQGLIGPGAADLIQMAGQGMQRAIIGERFPDLDPLRVEEDIATIVGLKKAASAAEAMKLIEMRLRSDNAYREQLKQKK